MWTGRAHTHHAGITHVFRAVALRNCTPRYIWPVVLWWIRAPLPQNVLFCSGSGSQACKPPSMGEECSRIAVHMKKGLVTGETPSSSRCMCKDRDFRELRPKLALAAKLQDWGSPKLYLLGIFIVTHNIFILWRQTKLTGLSPEIQT